MKTSSSIPRTYSHPKKPKTFTTSPIQSHIQNPPSVHPPTKYTNTNTNNKINLAYQNKSCPTYSYSQSKYHQYGYSQYSPQTPNKKNIEIYDQDNQYLTTEFINQWQKMDHIKKQTYNKLRIKFIKKYPQFNQKYKLKQIQQSNSKISINLISNNPHQLLRNINHNYRIKKIKQNPFNLYGGFYSRSRKKCLYNEFNTRQCHTQQKTTAVPKMSFMSYMSKYDYRKQFYNEHVNGYSMIETRQQILDLQKYGTKSYFSLKKCLEDAIQVCIAEK